MNKNTTTKTAERKPELRKQPAHVYAQRCRTWDKEHGTTGPNPETPQTNQKEHTSPKADAHSHNFWITETDELGREFGYCSTCHVDMQDLKNGKGELAYKSHKRWAENNNAAKLLIDKMLEQPAAPHQSCVLSCVLSAKAAQPHSNQYHRLAAELERVRSERDALLPENYRLCRKLEESSAEVETHLFELERVKGQRDEAMALLSQYASDYSVVREFIAKAEKEAS